MVDIGILGAHSKLQRSVLVRMEGGREVIEKLLRYIVRKYIHEQFSHIFEIFDSH